VAAAAMRVLRAMCMLFSVDGRGHVGSHPSNGVDRVNDDLREVSRSQRSVKRAFGLVRFLDKQAL